MQIANTVRRLVYCSFCLLAALILTGGASAPVRKAPPSGNPLERYHLPWTETVRWSSIVDISTIPGATASEKLETAQARLVANGGGVVYFPPGVYQFQDDIRLRDGIVLRGAVPMGTTDARMEGYSPPTKFEFPKYVPKLEGNGTPIETAFKGIALEAPERASNCGIVDIAINRGHIHLREGAEHRKGKNRFVVGCLLRNTALADPRIPDASIGQLGWQRFTLWHGGAAIEAYTAENLLLANNRLPASGEDNFLMPGYVLKNRQGQRTSVDEGVLFDYDDRGGIVANDYCVGGGGGALPIGTPETHPWAFTKGIVLRENYIFCTGRSAIQFCGDGVHCDFNVIRFKPGIVRHTNTGMQLTSGSSTNDNRGVQMRGWRWSLEGNDYEVYKNLCADKHYYINDGEGLMHEGHCNSAIVDSRLINNRGNAYLSLFHTGGIDGLLIQGNTIRTVKGMSDGIAAIYVAAERNNTPYPAHAVRILNNTTSGSGIQISGTPGTDNLIANNHHEGEGGKLVTKTEVELKNNTGYTQ